MAQAWYFSSRVFQPASQATARKSIWSSQVKFCARRAAQQPKRYGRMMPGVNIEIHPKGVEKSLVTNRGRSSTVRETQQTTAGTPRNVPVQTALPNVVV